MAQKDTVDRILNAAEALFAERGFAETSLRTITSTANVNLAAVNYHFGSKKALIQAVFVRFLEPLSDTLSDQLDTVEEEGKEMLLDDLLDLLVAAVTSAHGNDVNRTASFMRLLSLAYTQSQGHLRDYLRERYGRVSNRYISMLRPACPQLSDKALFWNTHFALGAAVFSLSNYDALQAMHNDDTGEESPIREVIKRLLGFISAGVPVTLE
ncbi:MAG: TetR family transcriptional regulator [Moraxellaceae bacterium]|nr:MAG: TetR family transcriptional regulator [Moraxellaceae bacterium]